MQVSDGESDVDMRLSQGDIEDPESESEVEAEIKGRKRVAAVAARGVWPSSEDDMVVDSDDDVDLRIEENEVVEEPSPPPQPRLRIKLKLPALASSASTSVSTPTPAPEDTSAVKTASRYARSRDIDIESEDEDDADNEYARSTPSTSIAGPSGRPMTTRQAVLASVVDSTHVSLDESSSKKKKPLNDIELAHRREEIARKRKNLSEKKLEDEKAETINRLLKKQSRSKNKRSALATPDDRTPGGSSKPNPANSLADDESIPVDPEAEPVVTEEIPEPVMYRWVSSTKSSGDGAEKRMTLSFSVPLSLLPVGVSSPAEMDVDHEMSAVRERVKPKCDIEGCSEPRKYKLVKDWKLGACGMQHLKALEATIH